MKKLIKYSLIGGGVLLFLIIATVIAAPYLLNVNALKTWGEGQATAYLGRDVTIEDASFSWSGPKVKLSGLSIAEAQGMGGDPFASFQSFDLKLRLVDLFRLRLSVEHIILSGPRITVLRKKNGRFNFDDILDRINQPTAVAELPYAALDPGAGGIKAPPIDLLVKEIRMESGEVFFSDASIPRLSKGITIEGIELTLRDLSLDKPVTINAALRIGGPSPDQSPDQSPNQSKDLQFDGTVGPVGKVILPGKIPFDLKLEVLPFELARISRIIGPLPIGLSGVVSASETVKGSISEEISFEMDGALEKLNINGADNKPLVTGFTGSITQRGLVDLNNMNMTLEAFTLEAYQAVFEAAGSIRNLGATPLMDLTVKSNPIPLSGWEKVLPDLGPMVKLDGDLTFEGSVTGTVGKDLFAELGFRSKRFEMDRGPALMERSSSDIIVPPVGAAAQLEPIKAPPITVNGKITVEEGRFERITFTDLSAVLSQRETLFTFEELKLGAFSGRLAGSAWTELGTLPLAYGTKMMMTGVEVNEALTAVANMDGIVYGKASMDVSIEGKGTEFADLEKYLTGKGAVKAANGRLTTANLGGDAARAAALLGLEGRDGETQFEDMDVSFTIAEGKVMVSNMRISTGEYSLKARGDIGLDKSLDMTSRMTLSREKSDQIPANRRRLFPREPDGRVQIPLKIGGTVTSPRIGLDSSAMDEAAKTEVKKEIKEKTEDLKKKIGTDLGEKLKKLF
ncbi:MAG: AsmA family protein [bacterium]|nr:AsmA family protein [bacterium]MDT8365550.1 AsmA family protein [bacterium]